MRSRLVAAARFVLLSLESRRRRVSSEEGNPALVDWTVRSLAKGKRGKIPAELRPILDPGREAVAMGQQRLVEVQASRGIFRSEGVA